MQAKKALALFKEASAQSLEAGVVALMTIVRDTPKGHRPYERVFRETCEGLSFMGAISLNKVIDPDIALKFLNSAEQAVRIASVVRKVDLMPEITPA